MHAVQASGPGGSPLKEQQTILGLYSSLTLRLPTSTNRTALPSLAAQVETAPARAQGQADSSTNSISEAVLATASEAEQVTIAMAYVPAGQVPGDLPACLQCASTDHITQPPPLCAFMEDECEDVDTDFRCIEAGLPYVSSLTLAALCLHGALTAANVAGAWVPVHRNTYQQCVRFFADFVDAWRDISLRVDVAKQWDPQEYKIPSLGPCISFICKWPHLHCCYIAYTHINACTTSLQKPCGGTDSRTDGRSVILAYGDFASTSTHRLLRPKAWCVMMLHVACMTQQAASNYVGQHMV